jgi:hypothetical protein
MRGPDPVVSIPASQTLNNDLVDEHPMDEDTPWFCWSRAFTVPYTLIVPDIVYDIILRQRGFFNTLLYEGCCCYLFVAYTETELVWARCMDYILWLHNLQWKWIL